MSCFYYTIDILADTVERYLQTMSDPNVSSAIAAIKTLLALIRESEGKSPIVLQFVKFNIRSSFNQIILN